MSNFDGWTDSQRKKINRIEELLKEIANNHKQMQSMLSDAYIKSQTERGVREIEDFLRQDFPHAQP